MKLYCEDVERALEEAHSSREGLTSAEAQQRLVANGRKAGRFADDRIVSADAERRVSDSLWNRLCTDCHSACDQWSAEAGNRENDEAVSREAGRL